MKDKILSAIKKLREKSKKRNFPQSFDLIVNLKEFDVKKPENKISEVVVLPHGRGKEGKVVIFSDEIKVEGLKTLRSEDISKLAKNKREAKKLIRETDFFLAEPKLMPLIGRTLGQFLGPTGKMPKLTTGDIKSLVEDYKKSVRIRIKDAPVIQCLVGTENMKEEEIADNVEAVLKTLIAKLPKGKNNISKIMIKLTMSKPVRIEV